jgi:two-component system chemotaxis response regulator CheY
MKTKILSVDDSATMRKVVGRTVAVLGFDLMEANNGEEAIEKIKANPGEVALVILDVNMPVLDGEETLHRMKADPELSDIPVMMLTTESERNRVLGFIQAGAANYLMKPFSGDDLAAKITASLGLGF